MILELHRLAFSIDQASFLIAAACMIALLLASGLDTISQSDLFYLHVSP